MNSTCNTNATDSKKKAARRHPELDFRPLVVRPREGRRLLGNMCSEKFWGLLDVNGGPLQSYRDGRARLVSMASIERYVVEKLAVTPTKDAQVSNAIAGRAAQRAARRAAVAGTATQGRRLDENAPLPETKRNAKSVEKRTPTKAGES